MTSIGDLRHRVTIQTLVATDDGAGGSTETPSTVGTVWAAVDPLDSREVERYAGLGVEATHRVTIRPTAVKSGDLLNFRRRRLRVQTVTDVGERRRWLELICQEIQ